MRTPLLIDTDTASDDAVALILALREPAVEVVAITIVAGNVAVEQGSRNAALHRRAVRRSVPVYEGAARPLVRPPVDASFFHGKDGLGDQGYPPPKAVPAKGYGPDALVERIRERPGLVLVTLGPLTNVALALQKAPDIASKVSRCVVMVGAACTVGNVTPAAEYNIWCDPEAARVVFRSGLPIEMVGWELCRGPGEPRRGRHRGLPCARHEARPLHDRLQHGGPRGQPAPLPRPGHRAARPGGHGRGARSRDRDTHQPPRGRDRVPSPLTRGMTVVDSLDVVPRRLGDPAGWPEAAVSGPPNATIVWEIDVARFKERLFRALAEARTRPSRRALSAALGGARLAR